MPQFRKKPVVVEAVQWTGDNAAEILELSNFSVAVGLSLGQRVFEVKTLDGVMVGQVGDWLIKGVAGEFYPCKPDIFETIYEPA